MMQIPFLNMKKESENIIRNGLLKDIEGIILSNRYLFGEYSERLEKYLSNFFSSNAILVGSGTDALFLALKAIGIKNGDYVAIPAFSAIPTAIAVKMLGAIPVYIDIDDSITLNPDILQQKIEQYDIKAVIPVHIFGNTAKIDIILEMCNKKNIPVVEDCAQSFGTKFKNRLIGTFGICGALSFYPTKNLGAMGDAGAVITSDESIAKSIRELRFYGQVSRYKMGDMEGINSRIDEFQSAVLLQKIKFLKGNAQKKEIVKNIYDERFKNFRKPEMNQNAEIVLHLYPLISNNRGKVMSELKKRGIETLIHYPFDLQQEIEKQYVNSKAKEISKSIFSLPFHPWIRKKEIEYICKMVEEVMNEDIINW